MDPNTQRLAPPVVHPTTGVTSDDDSDVFVTPPEFSDLVVSGMLKPSSDMHTPASIPSLLEEEAFLRDLEETQKINRRILARETDPDYESDGEGAAKDLAALADRHPVNLPFSPLPSSERTFFETAPVDTGPVETGPVETAPIETVTGEREPSPRPAGGATMEDLISSSCNHKFVHKPLDTVVSNTGRETSSELGAETTAARTLMRTRTDRLRKARELAERNASRRTLSGRTPSGRTPSGRNESERRTPPGRSAPPGRRALPGRSAPPGRSFVDTSVVERTRLAGNNLEKWLALERGGAGRDAGGGHVVERERRTPVEMFVSFMDPITGQLDLDRYCEYLEKSARMQKHLDNVTGEAARREQERLLQQVRFTRSPSGGVRRLAISLKAWKHRRRANFQKHPRIKARMQAKRRPRRKQVTFDVSPHPHYAGSGPGEQPMADRHVRTMFRYLESRLDDSGIRYRRQARVPPFQSFGSIVTPMPPAPLQAPTIDFYARAKRGRATVKSTGSQRKDTDGGSSLAGGMDTLAPERESKVATSEEYYGTVRPGSGSLPDVSSTDPLRCSLPSSFSIDSSLEDDPASLDGPSTAHPATDHSNFLPSPVTDRPAAPQIEKHFRRKNLGRKHNWSAPVRGCSTGCAIRELEREDACAIIKTFPSLLDLFAELEIGSLGGFDEGANIRWAKQLVLEATTALDDSALKEDPVTKSHMLDGSPSSLGTNRIGALKQALVAGSLLAHRRPLHEMSLCEALHSAPFGSAALLAALHRTFSHIADVRLTITDLHHLTQFLNNTQRHRRVASQAAQVGAYLQHRRNEPDKYHHLREIAEETKGKNGSCSPDLGAN
ncbi:hypothetical protein GNI_057310 [Gregarina niphandrodes]|uniref:Uncharacterized protein n=1 Tax=Gregarina niphandrodes TaxID=110365 RepID=A0A023B8N7_GRENI|nr:hypothetical protein GNI_057310 [Gregarina niphandrodes]EZG69649.1 hypothetical protein GNI_057310 [Gregarina niphandrodes]|eukprot:XP_011129989.1 hypothetical protein GNI_057310 [Gregarina niphandrodes]